MIRQYAKSATPDAEAFSLVAAAEKNGISRRDVLDFFAAGGIASLLSSIPDAGYGALPDDGVVRLGYLPITDATALLVAHVMGYFEDEGLDVAEPTLIRGWAPLTEAFIAGRVNVVHLLKPIPVWMRYNNKIPVKILAWAHTNGSGIVVGGQTGIHDFADLGGRQIAVPFWYSMHNIVLQIGLRHHGIVPVIKPQSASLAANECNLQVLPPPEMPAALAARKIDGYIVAEPFNAFGELRAGARMLRFTGDVWKNHPCCVVTVHERDTEGRPEWTQKVVNAIVRAQIFAARNKKLVARMISRDGRGYLPMPGDVVEHAITFYDTEFYGPQGAIRHAEWDNGRVDFQPWPYPSATRLIVEAMNETLVEGDTTFLDNLDPAFAADDLVDYRFVRHAIQQHPDWQADHNALPDDPFRRTETVNV